MELELEGNLVLERPPTRRWIAVIAIVVPVIACVSSVAWFIRAFIAPPMAGLPASTQLAAAPPPTPYAPAEPKPPIAVSERKAPPPQETAADQTAGASTPPASAAPAETSVSLPMFATLSAAPPSFDALSGFPDPAQNSAAAMSGTQATAEPAAPPEAPAPIAGPIPLPHPKPHFPVALVSGPVPLPRPRPADEAPAQAPDLPAFDRHAVD